MRLSSDNKLLYCYWVPKTGIDSLVGHNHGYLQQSFIQGLFCKSDYHLSRDQVAKLQLFNFPPLFNLATTFFKISRYLLSPHSTKAPRKLQSFYALGFLQGWRAIFHGFPLFYLSSCSNLSSFWCRARWYWSGLKLHVVDFSSWVNFLFIPFCMKRCFSLISCLFSRFFMCVSLSSCAWKCF